MLNFLASFNKIRLGKNIQNQHKHIIGWVVTIVVIRNFLDPESYGQVYLSMHEILIILKFSTQPDSPYGQILRKAGQKKTKQTGLVFRLCSIGCPAAAA